MTALSSISNSIQSFVNSETGLGEEIEYIQAKTGNSLVAKRIKEYKESETRHRKSDTEEILDRDIFLININVIPVKNDKIIYNGKTFYVDNFIEVADSCWRIYVNSDKQKIPKVNSRYEI